MRRTRCDSTFRHAARLSRPAIPVVLSIALLLGTPGLAAAEPDAGPNTLAALIADVAEAPPCRHSRRA